MPTIPAFTYQTGSRPSFAAMTTPAANDLSIAAVERETGLSKDTLRVWERRYNFPVPGRDAFGERVYPPDQVEKLRLIRSLMDQGHRPGRIVGEEVDALRALAGQRGVPETVQAEPVRADLAHYIALCKAHQSEALRRELSQALLREGIYRFVVDIIAPLNELVGAAWAGGVLAVFEEHLYTECVQGVMRNAIASIPQLSAPAGEDVRPRILLTTLPHEQHGLGLLMSEAIFSIEGARCLSLGTQTPVLEIVRASEAHGVDIVALSFSACARPAVVLEALADLRAGLPAQVEIWAGGRCPILQRRPPPQVNVLELHDIRGALTAWRTRRSSPA